ncbi:MAG: carboxypeptidase-like regulatory domain-containing protein [Vicinamibacterales bacterium]
MSRKTSRLLILLALIGVVGLVMPTGRALAQVTTAGITGEVKDSQGAVVPGVTITAVHEPSETTYTAVTQADGRFLIPGMRVGGPYRITAELQGFRTETRSNIQLSLGVTADVNFALNLASVQETVEVVGVSNPVFSSTRTGAATAVTREELATLPTVSGRINDITRLTPQSRRQRHVLRSGQPDEQHHDRRLLFQQLVRPRRSAWRPHRCRAGLARSGRTGAGQRRAVRRAPG